MMRTSIQAFVAAAIVCVGLMTMSVPQAARADTKAYALAAAAGNNPQGTFYTVGWAFTLTEDVYLTSLGYSESNAGPVLAASHLVTLYTNDGTELTSATIAGGSAVDASNFAYNAVSPLLLTANTTYVIGGNSNEQPYSYEAIGVFAPQVQFINGRYSNPVPNNTTNQYPGITAGSTPSLFGPSFGFTAVPEPASVTLLLAGASLVLRRRRA